MRLQSSQRFNGGIVMTIQNITMPQLGESVTEGTIERWIVKPGDTVKKYDPLAEVTTDKVNAEIPSSFEGVIHELIAKPGDTMPIGAVVCSIQVEGLNGNKSGVQTSKTTISPTLNNVIPPKKKEEVKAIVRKDTPRERPTNRFSPAVLTLASEHSIDLSLVQGTGLGGRITRKDIEKIIADGGQRLFTPQAAELEREIMQTETNTNEIGTVQDVHSELTNSRKEHDISQIGDREIPVTGIRRAIAQNMVRAKTEVPHAWMMVEVDVTNLVAYRNAIKSDFKQREGLNLTYFPFFIKAVAQALKEFPMMNSMWANDKIIQKKDINLSIAVATDDALFVPVIKHADEKTIKGLARELDELTRLVRSGKLKSEHMQGGTFTVNNTGSFGSVQSAGIINYPQAAILQVEAIVKRPVIIQENMFAARDMVNICLSLDHRVLDGYVCGKFLSHVKYLLENVKKDNISIY